MKKKIARIIFYLLATSIVAFFITTLIYRISSGETKRFEAEIQYQMLEFGQLDFIRCNIIEDAFRNRRVFLRSDSIPWVYVTHDDFSKCWPLDAPSEMKGFTIKATFETRPLWLIHGFTVATVIDTHHVAGKPFITK